MRTGSWAPKVGDSTWGGWATPASKMKGLNTDLMRHRWKDRSSSRAHVLPCPLVSMSSSASPGWVWCGSEEMDTGLCGILGQDRHHTGGGAEASRVHADAALLVPEDVHHHLRRDTPCKPKCERDSQLGCPGPLATTHRPCRCCSNSCPARKRALAASIRTGCWVREKTSAKSKVPCPVHQPWALAWLRSSGCSAEMSVPMLSWLEMFRAPPVEEEGFIHLTWSTRDMPNPGGGGCLDCGFKKHSLPSRGLL